MVRLTRKPKRQNLSRSLVWTSIVLLLLVVWLCSRWDLLLHPASSPSSVSSSIGGLLMLQDGSGTTTATTKQEKDDKENGPVKIAHVVSLISCKKASRTAGFLDAMAILRHSIHQNSIHNSDNNKDSKYSYQMVAIVHKTGGCDVHLEVFERLGYKVLVRDTPIQLSHIQNEWYRTHVSNENCCGEAEFIKLYAYTLTEYPIVVHWDLDVAVLQPMDVLFDSMLCDKDSAQGKRARALLQTQFPNRPLPDRIQAFFTRDVTSATPRESVRAVQGGFVVARPNQSHFERYLEFILEGNYKPGRGPTSGWGGLGYGGFQGAMAYQGVLAYFYDQIVPGTSVELDVCKWNQVVADVIWRGPDLKEHMGQCRQHPEDENYQANTPENNRCTDCRVLSVEETMTVHYTACKKPWECRVPHPRVPGPRRKAHTYRLQELTNITTCGLLFRKYFDYRREIEEKIARATSTSFTPPQGSFEPDSFNGYCNGSGQYITMDALPEGISMKDVYGF